VVGEQKPSTGIAVVTFDDGWRDAITNAVPVLARHDASATFFVCCGWFGGQHPEVPGENGRLMSRTDISELVQHGMTVGSHSMTHRDLRGLDDAELKKEVRDSKAILEDVTGIPCRLFAYPFGLFDARVEHAVEAAGYDAAFAWSPGPWRRYAVPRMPAPPRHGPSRLGLKLQLRIRRRA
jgi:peptidoglycan/xylan/chitin deacetylase (PgdA/CDA1 family)